MKRLTFAAFGWLAFFVPALAGERPPEPGQSTDAARCEWLWKEGGGLGVWTERCTLQTGIWEPQFREGLPGFVLTVDREDNGTVLQLFTTPAGAEVSAILPELRRRGYIPDDGDCIFAPAISLPPVRGTLAFFEIMPTGARKAAFDATPEDEVPEPPCGEYGWSTHGVRYFMTDNRYPDRVVYINIGQDGLMFDATTVTLE